MESNINQTLPKKKFPNYKMIIFILGVLLVVAIAAGGYFFYKSAIDPQSDTKKEAERAIQQVARHMVLPDETPTVATVSDPDKLRDQQFFANAKRGDKVLIYSGAQKAILYDPVADRIVEVAPVNLGGSP